MVHFSVYDFKSLNHFSGAHSLVGSSDRFSGARFSGSSDRFSGASAHFSDRPPPCAFRISCEF